MSSHHNTRYNIPSQLFPKPLTLWLIPGITFVGLLVGVLIKYQVPIEGWQSIFLSWEFLFAHALSIGVIITSLLQVVNGSRLKLMIDKAWLFCALKSPRTRLANPDQIFLDMKQKFDAIERVWNRWWQLLLLFSVPISICGYAAMVRFFNNPDLNLQTRLTIVIVPVIEFLLCTITILFFSVKLRSVLAICLTRADGLIQENFTKGEFNELIKLPAIEAIIPSGETEIPDPPHYKTGAKQNQYEINTGQASHGGIPKLPPGNRTGSKGKRQSSLPSKKR